MSETVDGATIAPNLMHLNDAFGADGVAVAGNFHATAGVTLTGATHDTEVDKTIFTITVTEVQRVAALAISGTPGGDSSAVVLDVEANALADMAHNIIVNDDNNPVDEMDDTFLPQVIGATMNYNDNPTLDDANCRLVVTFDETV